MIFLDRRTASDVKTAMRWGDVGEMFRTATRRISNDAKTFRDGVPMELDGWYYVRGVCGSEPLVILPSRADCEAWGAVNRPFVGCVVEPIARLILFPG